MNPRLSIVICTYNRVQYLRGTLESYGAQQVDFNSVELLVVDNNSTDETKEAWEAFSSSHPELNSRYIFEARQGLSYARNRGIEEARGSYIAFIDDDVILSENYADEVIRALDNHPECGAMGGKVIPAYPPGVEEPIWLSKPIMGVVSAVDLGPNGRLFDRKYPAGCNMAFRKEVFDEIGLFNTDLMFRSDDKDIFHRVKMAGIPVWYAPEAFLHHFMDHFRIQKPYLRKLSKQIGQSEKVRLGRYNPKSALYKKLIEYLVKLAAALILGIGHILQGSPAKAYYLVFIRWYILIGLFTASANTKASS